MSKKSTLALNTLMNQPQPEPPLPLTIPVVEVPDDQKTLIAHVGTEKAKAKKTAQPQEATTMRGRGRPPKAAKRDEIRSSFGLDPVTFKRLKFHLLERDMTLQEFIEEHIRKVLK